MRVRKEEVRPVRRAFAGRRLGMALATAGLVALSLTSALAASPANAAAHLSAGTASPAHPNVNVLEFFMQNDRYPNLCLSSSGAYNTIARVYSCTGNSNQTWHTGGHIQGHYGTYYQLINNHTGQCLGIAGASTAQGANAVVWNCNGHHDQYWTWLTPGLPNVGVFIDQNSSLVLQITSGSSGGVVTQSYYGGALGRQAWIF